MRGHILSLLSETHKKLETAKTYYSFISQLSYYDKQCSDKVITHFVSASTVETNAIESSDPDQFSANGPRTIITETIENSDADEFQMQHIGTVETRSIETSDSDGYYCVSSKGTFTIETSDPDSFVPAFI